MAQTIEELGQITGKRTPGLVAKIEVIEERLVTTIPDPNEYVHANFDPAVTTTLPHTISSDLVVEANAEFKKLHFRDNAEANYTCVSEGDEDGEEQVVTISFFRPAMDAFTAWLLSVCENERMVVKFWDKDKSTAYPRLAGEKLNGVRVVVNEQARPKNGYMVTMTCRMRKKPYYYAGA